MTAKQREEFIGILCREYPNLSVSLVTDVARKLMRLSATHCRMAEALCNGTYPADNGLRPVKVCDKCGMGWAPASFRCGVCPDCRTEEKIILAAERLPGCEPTFSGDPRGCTVKLRLPSRRTNDYYGEGICVPQ